MAIADLDSTVANTLAAKFKTIVGFPWDALHATAEDLVRWCTGAVVDNRVWPPEAQARRLVNEARETWEKWAGTAALKALFDAKFRNKKPPANGFQDPGEEPPIECVNCTDTGIVRFRGRHQYCDCDLGVRMHTDSGENGKKWLARMDKSFVASFRPEPVRRAKPSLQELETEYFASQARDEQPPEEGKEPAEDD
jgi:hypothetical protein